ncbi:hypothetical protein BDK51DRAFT_37131, partial [Blyttiomyces helicus]
MLTAVPNDPAPAKGGKKVKPPKTKKSINTVSAVLAWAAQRVSCFAMVVSDRVAPPPHLPFTHKQLILASGLAATPSFPAFFSTLQIHLRPRTKTDPPLKPRALTPARRAQSMCILPLDAREPVQTIPAPLPTPERRAPSRGPAHLNMGVGAPPPAPAAAADSDPDVLDFDAEFGFAPTPARPNPLGARGPTTERNISPRRIQSAPMLALKRFPSDALLLDEGDDTGDEWIVPSVKAKAARRRERDQLLAADVCESWDDDFDVGEDGEEEGGGLSVPEAVRELQVGLRGDIENVKRFA